MSEIILTTLTCPNCHADRPADEIKHKDCNNCKDLALRKKAATDATDNAKKQAEADKQMTEDLKSLPDVLDKSATSLYDNERGVWWLGVNLKNKDANPVGCMLIMDQAKLAMIQCLGNWQVTQRKRESLIVRVGNTAVGTMKSAKQKVENLFAVKP